MTDEELIELFFSRSEAAVSALQAQYGPYCRAIAQRLLTDSRDVEECLSDCALAVWNAIPPTRPEHFKGWLGSIVRHRALAIGRKNGRRPETVDELALELGDALPQAGSPHDQLECAELGRVISEFLWTQKPDRRAAFLRRYWYADSIAQIAGQMHWSVSKTKSVLFHTRNRLREHLKKEGYFP